MSLSLNNSSHEFFGVWTALATPFRSDLQIDWEAFERLLSLQAAAKVAGIVIAGTTGESATLTVQEKLSLVRKARTLLPKTVRVMAGAGDNNTQQSVEMAKLAQDAGADSLLIVTPPYNKPSTAGLVGHYKAIGAATTLPLCLYHVPSRTAHSLTLEALTTVCREANIAVVKEASADVAYFSRAQAANQIPFLSGDDPTFLPTLAVGGRGVISVSSNLFPKEFVALFDTFMAGDHRRAQALHDALMPAIDAMFYEVNPCPLKAAMSMMGLAKNVVRMPLATVTETTSKRVEEALAKAKAQLGRLL